MQELMLNSRVVIGIDFSLKTLKACKRRYPSALLVCGDIEYLPFKDESVDSFFSFHSLYYLPFDAQENLFRELYRVLKKNGNLLLIEPNGECLLRWRVRPATTYDFWRTKVEKQLKRIGFANVSTKLGSSFSTRKNPVLTLFHFLESIFEFSQFPWLLGEVIVYAQKPGK